MKHLIKKSVGLQKQWLVHLCMMLMLLVAGSVVPVSAQRTISVNQAYEDSLRIVILWNNAAGNCTTMPNVGAQTRDTVLRALGITYNSNTRAITSSGTTNIRPSHVKVLMEDSTTNSTIDPTWNTIRGLWGGDSLPHVIVHVNAGWYTCNGKHLKTIIDSALANYIGVTEIGDDASYLATNSFGLQFVSNDPQPMGDAIKFNGTRDSLWVGIHAKKEVVNDPTDYPNLRGLIKNIDSLLHGDSILYFKPYVNSPVLLTGQNSAYYSLNARCQADADKYKILTGYASKLVMLGYQQGRVRRPNTGTITVDSLVVRPNIVNGVDSAELDVIVAIQDTVYSGVSALIRRGVMLSIEPQFLKNGPASQQLVYDAILYGSLSWQNRPPAGINLALSGDTLLRAGDTLRMTASVYDAVGKLHPEYADSVQWSLLPLGSASYMMKSTKGATNAFIAIDAYQHDTIVAKYIDLRTSRYVSDTVFVRVIPGDPTHVVVEATSDSTVSLRDDNPLLPKPSTLTMTGTTNSSNLYAVLRDKYGNWVSHAPAVWTSRNTAVVTAAYGNTALGEGIITRVADSGTTTIVAKASGTSLLPGATDSVRCILNRVSYSQIQIYVVSGGVKPIDTLSMRTDQDTTLHVRGLRAGTSKWDDIQADWTNSDYFTLDNPAPLGSPTWTFNPQVADTGFIGVSYESNGTTRRDSIKVFFKDGLPFSMALYPKAGAPGSSNAAYPPSVVCTAGVALPVTAKLFDTKHVWLSAYETSTAPFTWTVTEVSGTGSTGALSSYSGFQTAFTPRRAYNTVQITARYADGTIDTQQTLLVYVVPGKPTHLVLEGDTARSASPNADNPLSGVTIGANDTSTYAYAILRDAYGNWVNYSLHTEWRSFDTTKAVAYSSDPTIGRGIITRISNGTTYVSAQDSVNTGSAFCDTIPVNVSSIYYTELHIVVRDSVQIQNLSMSTDQDTLLSVVGRRSDNPSRWSPVPGVWSMVPTIATSTSVPSSASSWRFSPNDTGTCKISVSYSGAVPDTITATFVRGAANKLVLYPASGSPDVTSPYAAASSAIIDTAGKVIPLVAKIFDKKGAWLSQYEGTAGASRIKWNVVELTGNPPTGTLTKDSGAVTSYTPTRAYNTLYVVATYTDPASVAVAIRDTIQVKVVSGTPVRLFIEGDPNWASFKNAANPIDSILIDTNTTTYSDAYAILRDAYGNYVSYSLNTGWSSVDSNNNPDITLITAQNGAYSIGQGIITRVGTNGWAKAIAADRDYPSLADTVKVFVRQYRYDSLRIVVGTTPSRIETLTMSTNADTTLKVQGRRSDNHVWEYASAKWNASTNLKITPAAPNSSSKWTFSPDTAGTGWIWVIMSNDTATRSDSVRVTFTRGEPTLLTLTILTQPQLRVAGDTITAVVKLSNKDGLYPGDTILSTKHGDALGQGGSLRPAPILLVDGQSATLNPYLGTGTSFSGETFARGLDTIKYVLYFAPNITDSSTQTDSMQTLYVSTGSLIANSGSFIVHPAKLVSLAIKDALGADLDTVKLDYAGNNQKPIAKVLTAKGFDRYSNVYTLPKGANWSVTDSLHAIDNPFNTASIYYTAKYVTGNESGYIKAAAADTGGTIFSDSTYVVITGPGPIVIDTNHLYLLKATTGDVNGNGYLDKVTLHFSKNIKLSGTYSVFDSINVYYANGIDTTVFNIDSVNGIAVDSVSGAIGADNSDSVFVLSLTEQKKKGFQTSWKPYVTVKGIGGYDTLLAITADDKAGPVISTATKDSTNLVTVTFSEPVRWNNTASLQGKDASQVFVVFDTVSQADTNRLKGNTLVLLASNGSSVTFLMTSGISLTSKDSLAFRTDMQFVADTLANSPNSNNRRVAVVEVGTGTSSGGKLDIGPNPTRVNSSYPGQIDFTPVTDDWHSVTANGGVIISFVVPVSVSSGSNPDIKGYVKVFDVAGNLVAYDESTISSSQWTQGTPIGIYWSGKNGQGMRVAPGTYRALVSITAGSAKKKYTGTVGIRR